MRDLLTEALKDVSIRPVSAIYQHHLNFSYEEPDFLKNFDYGNTLIEASLPYCLHVPNEYEYEIPILEEGIKALVTLRKIWTEKSVENRQSSSIADFYTDDRTLYFRSSAMLAPQFPIQPEEGWQQNFTGTNIERIKEQNGVFRYTRLYIQFDTDFSVSQLAGEKASDIILAVREKGLMVVNKLIDAYRFVTKQEYIQRLGTLETSLVYFIAHNTGFHTSYSGFGIETAPMNRSRKEIKEIGRLLANSERPELYELFLLDAQSSFDNKDFALAVMRSFQALEIYIENLLFRELRKLGNSEIDAENYLGKHWRTKDRLKEALKELKGSSLYEIDNTLWNQWCVVYDQTRNQIVHKGKEPKIDEVKKCLDCNISVLQLLKNI